MRRGRPPYPDLLTPREQEVMQLLREGLTNREIAERLGISLAGARYHVSEILSKLGVSSREEAARWQGERFWALGGIGALLAKVRGVRWEALMKAMSVATLAGAGGAGVLLVAGVLLTMASRSDDSQQSGADSESTPLSQPSGQDLQAQLPEYQEYGPYRIAPNDYEGDESTIASPLLPPEEEHGSVASGLEEARRSSLFPEAEPAGYTIVDADSDGRPSELFLRLVIDGPTGRFEVERSRPETMPVDVRYDVDTSYLQMAFQGFAIIPDGGDEHSSGAYLRGMHEGIDTVIFGPAVSVNSAHELYRLMFDPLDEDPASSMLPRPSRGPGSQPLQDDILISGSCDIDAVVTPHYVWRAAKLEIATWLSCRDVIPLGDCAPGMVRIEAGLEVACDANGHPIVISWTIAVAESRCEGRRTGYVEDEALVSGETCSTGVPNGTGTSAPIEACVSIRNQETCASFVYVVP